MPVITYRAVNDSGEVIEQTREVASIEGLSGQLESEGMILISTVDSATPTRSARSKGRRTLSTADLALFCKQLASLLNAGVPLAESMQILASQATENQRDVLNSTANDLRRGESLSVCLSRHPKDFSKIFVATVSAAERVGALPTAFRQLSDILMWEHRLVKDVRSALRYPSAVLAAMVIAMVVLQQVVVPQFSKVFRQLGGDLPMPTKILMFSTDLMTNYWWAILGGLVAGAILFRHWARTDVGKRIVDERLLALPVVGTLLRHMYLARFARTFALLQGNGLPILSALEVLADTVGNDKIAREVRSMHTRLTNGQTLAEAVAPQPSFDPLVKNMIRVGERGGQLDDTLRTVSEYYDEETRTAVQGLTQWIEPILTIGLGGFVLFLALAIFLPWWDMTGLYKNG